MQPDLAGQADMGMRSESSNSDLMHMQGPDKQDLSPLYHA